MKCKNTTLAILILCMCALADASLSDGLAGYWPLDEGTGTIANDFSGNGHVGTVQNGAAWINGKIGNAISFDGKDSYVRITAASGLPVYNPSTGYSVSAWVKGGPQASKAVYAEGNTANSSPVFWLYADSSGKLGVHIRNSNGTSLVPAQTSAGIAFNNSWKHIAWADFNGAGKLYIDGVLDRVIAYSPQQIALNTSAMGAMIRGSTGNFFKGSVDDLRAYNRELSAGEIREIYDSGKDSITDDSAPSAPAGILATAISSSQASVSWDASADNNEVAGYRIYRNETLAGNSPGISFTDSGLRPDTSYSYTIEAYDAGGNISAMSSAAFATTLPAPPPSSYTLVVTKSGTGSGTITGAGINCGSDCSETLNAGTSVTLTATPGTGSAFSGWSGAGCLGTGACTLSLNSNLALEAGFGSLSAPSIRDWYVSTGGSNTNSGSNSSPFLTLDYALGKANAGDTIRLAAGTFAGGSTKRNGTASYPITITGLGDGTTIINGKLTVYNSYYKITGIKFQGTTLALYGSGANNNTIERNEFTKGAQGIYMQGGETNDGTSGPAFTRIMNNTFYAPTGNGMVAMIGHDNTVSNNIFRDGLGYDALRVWGKTQVISGNQFIRFNSDQGATGGNHADIIQTFESSAKMTARGIVFERNYIMDSNGQFGNLDSGSGYADMQDWTFRNNIFLRSRLQLNNTLPGVRIYNNTIYDSPFTIGFLFAANADGTGAHNGQVFNNLFISVGDGLSKGTGFYSFNPRLRGMGAGYNIITDRDNSAKVLYYPETHGINGGVTPQEIFADPANGDLRLKPNSPAINAGTDLSTGFNTDYAGTPRPQGTGWDIGAYEYMANSQAPVPTDSDGDGVPNTQDRCPKTAAAARAFVNRYGCALPIATKFDIAPDFNATDINGMQNLELGISQYGKISYTNKSILLVKMSAGEDDMLNLDADLNISQNKITLNQNNLPQLNQSATITIYNTNFTNPKILKDGTECTNCQIASYNRNSKTITFSVPEF